MKLLKPFIFLTCFIFIIPSMVFASPDPMAMLKPVSNKMLVALRQNRPRLRKNPNYIYRLVRRIVLPHVDLVGMSRSVLGRGAWTSATAPQQKAFTKAFTTVIIRTYASALNAYQDETIRFFPIRGGYQGRRRIMVQSKVIRPDGPPIPVYYRLALKGNRWKMYDLVVEGISLLQSFHAQFADDLSQGKSVAQITRKLRQRQARR